MRGIWTGWGEFMQIHWNFVKYTESCSNTPRQSRGVFEQDEVYFNKLKWIYISKFYMVLNIVNAIFYLYHKKSFDYAQWCFRIFYYPQLYFRICDYAQWYFWLRPVVYQRLVVFQITTSGTSMTSGISDYDQHTGIKMVYMDTCVEAHLKTHKIGGTFSKSPVFFIYC